MEWNHTNTSTQQSYYSFREVIQKPKVAAIFSFLVALTLLTLIGNAIVIWTVLKTRRLRFLAFYFVTSLAVADFLVGLFVLPISLAYHITFEMKGAWVFGSWTCKLWLLVNFWFCSASIFNLCLISWDRYVAVTSPLRYKARMSNVKVKRLIAINWTFSFSVAIILVTKARLMAGSKTNCTIHRLRDLIFTTLAVGLLFVIPVTFLIFVNTRVWFVARRHKKRIQTFWDDSVRFRSASLNDVTLSSRGTGTSETTTLDRKRWSLTRTIKQELRTFRTFVIVIGVLFVCWCPFFVFMVVDNFLDSNPLVLYIIIILAYSNSAMNVFIYGVFNYEFRRAMKESICC